MAGDEQDSTVAASSNERERERSVSEQGGRGTEPPTLPPFAGDGPKPQTMYGMPAVDVFEGVDDLFEVPAIGTKPPAAPVASPPPLLPELAPLQPRKGPPPPKTGPHAIVPPISPPRAGVVRPAIPGPAGKAAGKPSDGVPSQIGPEQPVETPTRSTTLPSAAGLIAKIRAAKPKQEDDPAASDTAKPEFDKPATLSKAVGPSKPAPAAAPTFQSPPPLERAPATLEPVEAHKSQRAATPKRELIDAPAPAPSSSDLDEEVTYVASKLRSESSVANARDDRTVPGEPSAASSNTLQTMAGGSRSPGDSGSKRFAPPPPITKRPLAPPPPTTTTSSEDAKPKVGVPYEPPALILKPKVKPDAEQAASAPGADEAVSDEQSRSESTLGSARLPTPGARLPPASETVAQRIALVPTHAAESSAELGAPATIPPQDTGALIDGLASELIAESEREAAATVHAKLPKREQAQPSSRQKRKVALYFLGAAAALSLIVALLPGQESDSAREGGEQAGPVEIAKEKPLDERPMALADSRPEPKPEPQAKVEAEPEAEPEPEPEAEPEPEPEPEAKPEPQPKVASTKPKTSKSKPKPTPKVEPKPEPEPAPKPTPTPKPTPKPAAGGPEDPRNDKELYTAAKAAYNSGNAAEAYKLAYASYRKKSNRKTAELMVLAACRMKDAGKAKASLSKVAAIRRPAMRKECSAMGVSL